MAFIDEITLNIGAGKGGDGVVRFLREKGKPNGGPNGGDGGNGGDVYVRGIRGMHGFFKYRNIKEVFAENGEDGGNKSSHGKGGEDLVLDFPIGTILYNHEIEKKYELVNEGEKVLILRGGRGGLGNEHFKSSKNQAPREFTKGKVGETASFFIELQLFADIGLVGFPNAGKSSLLNELSNATAKVGDYAFTTLEPNLGDFYGFIVADIPGLIEGAHHGKGLGDKFLRHIKRTKFLVHLISFENKDLFKAYNDIRKELSSYDDSLSLKKEIIILTKSDLVPKSDVDSLKKDLIKKIKNKNVFTVSLFDNNETKELREKLLKFLGE